MEVDLEEGELSEVHIEAEKPAESSSVPIAKLPDFDKPIPKRAGHDESSDDEPSGSSRLMNPGRLDDSETALLKILETDARNDLASFLKRKGVSDSVIGQYTVHVNFAKTKLKYLKDDKKRPTNIYYVAPDGSMLRSKNDAYSDALKYMRDTDDFSAQREKVHEEARNTLSKKQLPFVLNGVKVISFGQIDIRSGFHSPVQLWPVGYRCEQTVEGLTVNGLRTQDVICQIGVSEDGLPQFHIFVPNTESTFIASSEVNVWRKFNPQNLDTSWSPSFFNLGIELLLEGLPQALECEEYKFHIERGYKKEYSTDAELAGAKNSFLAKLSREKRTQERSRNKHMSAEEVARTMELQKLKDAEEMELKKAAGTKSKVVKEAEKEEAKKRRDQQRQTEAVAKEALRKKETEKKEQMREAEKQVKDKLKKYEKQRINIRKDLTAEVKKNRNDIIPVILQHFDKEENVDEAALHLEMAGVDLRSACMLDDAIVPAIISTLGKPMPFPMAYFAKDQAEKEHWDEFFYVLTGLNALKAHLGLDRRYSFDEFCLMIFKTLVTDEQQQEDEGNGNAAPPRISTANAFLDAELDRVQLNLVKVLIPEIQTLLELDEKEHGDPTRRKDKRQGAASYPINQLTWCELTRMILLNYFMQDLGRSKEDRQNILRGSKLPNFRIAKNVIRNIRYRWYMRAIKFPSLALPSTPVESSVDHMTLIHKMNYMHDEVIPAYTDTKNFPNMFDSVEDMIAKLNVCSAVDNAEYPEIYQRCAKVLLRLFDIRATENFLWEIDQELFPDYYLVIKHPVCISSIASKLIEKEYGYDEAHPNHVANQVFSELKQMFINCITYNTEYQTIVSQAQKLFHCTHRLMHCWIYSEYRPPVERCNDSYCLFSKVAFSPTKIETLRCGKCQGTFSMDAIGDIVNNKAKCPDEGARRLRDYLLEASQEMINSLNEEWHCPYCLQEDFVLCQKKLDEADLSIPYCGYYINEWGPSALMPWMFNEDFSTLMDTLIASQDHPAVIVNALKILGNQYKSNLINDDGKAWKPSERLTVISALVHALHAGAKASEKLKKAHDECFNALKSCSRNNFREADFMSTVRDLCGEEGLRFCRALLDGVGSANAVDPFLQSFLTEGRCTICNGSTYDEDNEDPAMRSTVILCDGCNAEAHLRCLDMTTVPTEAWYCSSCQERQAKRDSKVVTQLDNLDQYRNKDEEDRLLNDYVNSKIPELRKEGDVFFHEQCAYCSLNEFEVCSPLVIGQSLEEHDEWVGAITRDPVANNFFENKQRTTVTFLHEGSLFDLPSLDCPNFPVSNSDEGRELAAVYHSIGREPLVVHQICALQMFQARMSRSTHLQRRKRQVVGEKAVSLSGVNVQPLGTDREGNEYWKFPSSNELFIKMHAAQPRTDLDHAEFNKAIGKMAISVRPPQVKEEPSQTEAKAEETNTADKQQQWVMISDLEAIKLLASILIDTDNERQLRKSIISEVIVDKVLNASLNQAKNGENNDGNGHLLDPAALAAAAAANEEDENEGEDNDKMDEDAEEEAVKEILGRRPKSTDAVPVGLKLFTTKGQFIPSSFVIAEEAAFIDTVPTENDEEEDEGTLHLTFNTKSKKYYAIGLINNNGAVVKVGSMPAYGDYTVVYQIHHEGNSTPVATAQLSEPWTDHMYYFCTLLFKKSGRYTISFLVEGTKLAGGIKPLIFPVTVVSASVRYGVPDALHRLNAKDYIEAANRQVSAHRRELFPLLSNSSDEFNAVRCALVTVFLALPFGALSDVEPARELKNGTALMLEPTYWDAGLEQAWKNTIISAKTPIELMECVLTLEFYLQRGWLVAPASRLITSLPSPHFAIRCITLASVALRVYCLDKALAYEKVQQVARELRHSTGPARESSASLDDKLAPISGTKGEGRSSRYINRGESGSSPRTNGIQQQQQPRKRRSAEAANAGILRSSNQEDEDEEGELEDGQTPREARKRRKVEEAEKEDADYFEEEENGANGEDDDEGYDNNNGGGDYDEEGNAEVEAIGGRPSSWRCGECETNNEPRARSCSNCGERKPAAAVQKAQRGNSSGRASRKKAEAAAPGASRRGRKLKKRSGRLRRRSLDSDDDDDDDNDDDDNDEGEFDDDEEEGAVRRSARARKQLRYEEVDSADEMDDRSPRGGRGSNSGYYDDYISQLPAVVQGFTSDMQTYRSSNPHIPILDLNLRFLSILRRVLQDERSQAFWSPVNPMLVPNYRTFIKNPMDFGTITANVKSNHYAGNVDRFVEDMRLVFNNCRIFNLPTSLLYVYAEGLEQLFNDLLQRWILDNANRPADGFIVLAE